MKKRAPTLVPSGSVVVKVYHGERDGYPLHAVAYYQDGKRRKENFAIEEEALKRAKDIAELLARGEVRASHIKAEEVGGFLEAQNILAESGATVHQACREWLEARTLLDGRSLIDAVRYFARTHPVGMPDKTVSEVALELCQAKLKLGKNRHYVRQIRYATGKFTEVIQKNIAEVTAADVKFFVESISELSPRTRNNCIAGVRQLFDFAKREKYVPRDFDELGATEYFEDSEGEIVIYTPAEMAKLLSVADSLIIPALSISAFSGIRQSELAKLDWSEIDLRRGFLEVKGKKSKTKARRLVPISKNLKDWLTPYVRKSGPVLTIRETNYRELRREAAAKCGIKWKANAPRHSYCSYRLAVTHDAAKVSLEAGNSPAMLFAHYRQLATPAEGKRWFKISPKMAGNIVTLRKVG